MDSDIFQKKKWIQTKSPNARHERALNTCAATSQLQMPTGHGLHGGDGIAPAASEKRRGDARAAFRQSPSRRPWTDRLMRAGDGLQLCRRPCSGDLDGLQGWRACGSLLSGDRSLRRRRSSAGRRLDALPAGEIPGAHARDATAREPGAKDSRGNLTGPAWIQIG